MNIPDEVKGLSRESLLRLQGELLDASSRVHAELIRQDAAIDERPVWARKIGAWVDDRRMPRKQVGGKLFVIALAFLLLMNLPRLVTACAGLASSFSEARHELNKDQAR